MDLILNVKLKKKLEPGDILIYDGSEWKNVSKKEFLAELKNDLDKICEKYEDIKDLKHKIAELRGEDDEEA